LRPAPNTFFFFFGTLVWELLAEARIRFLSGESGIPEKCVNSSAPYIVEAAVTWPSSLQDPNRSAPSSKSTLLGIIANTSSDFPDKIQCVFTAVADKKMATSSIPHCRTRQEGNRHEASCQRGPADQQTSRPAAVCDPSGSSYCVLLQQNC
jgi:hypothetical protein